MASLLGVILLVQQALEFGTLKAVFLASVDNRLRGAERELLAAIAPSGDARRAPSRVALLALLSFAAWLALVTLNVPVLGGGATSRSPIRVFAYTLIPIWNLIKVPGMLQEVLYRIEPEEGGFGMVIAAWIGLVGSWLVSFLGGWMITVAGIRDIMNAPTLKDAGAVFGAMLDQSFVLGAITEVMIAIGATILVMLMARIERRCAVRDREIRAATAS